MTPVAAEATTAPDRRPARRWLPRTRSAWVKVLATVLVLATLVALAKVGWWMRHPTSFPDRAEATWGAKGHEPVGRAMVVGMTWPIKGSTEVITLRSITPHIVRDTGAARIEFSLCTNDVAGAGATILSVHEGDEKAMCFSLSPVRDAVLHLDAKPVQQILMSVELTRPGRIRIDGIDVTYTRGRQTGTQRVGGDIVLRSP